ncbi:LacI family DNA-binding transcriptional regulator [Aquisalibacillus elongatus]|uniref:LacI family transcriptional regulator n=1 Tax=Aquisalibacillus elongatus TaxID=485577 RepID=A0A3N5CBQ6_9BACI|nr:LacI family DNA-binding transcriptional regulator [Aquisalibacillus elongatus]RPF54301.1 LacI family transcriptional regulator [Aquisalibacillus elongatus]
MVKITIKEIANILNVSTATVSRVLNNAGGYSEETKTRVLDVLDQYNYQTNALAKGLRTNRTNSIGVVLPDMTNEYFAKIAISIEEFFVSKGYTINIYNVNEDANKEKLMMRDLDSRGVDGLIYVSGNLNTALNIYEKNIPIVAVNQLQSLDDQLPVVESDNLMGGYLATKTLLERGSKRIILLRDERDIQPINQRHHGFSKALQEFGYDSDLFVHHIPFNVERAESNVQQLIERGINFDGIFASSDLLAIGALKALHRSGIQIPDEVQVIGFDNITFSQYSYPTLSTIHQDTRALGMKAAELLLKSMECRQKKPISTMVIPVTLMERESTRCLDGKQF